MHPEINEKKVFVISSFSKRKIPLHKKVDIEKPIETKHIFFKIFSIIRVSVILS